MSWNEMLMSLEIGLIYGVVAMGVYLTFRVIDFPDLTCDGSFVLGAAVSSILIKCGHSPLLALAASLAAGSVAGMVTGLLTSKLKVTSLLSGILVAFMLYSVNLKIMDGVPNIALISEPTIFSALNPLLVIGLVCMGVWFVVSYLLVTDFGLALRSIGQNKQLAFTGGIRVGAMTVIGLALSNALIALGGALFSQHQGFADVSQGVGTVIVGLAAVIIGEKILPYRSPWVMVMACLGGSVVYRLFVSVALHSEVLGLETQDLNLITGLMVIGVMLLPKRQPC
jgi:putative ABC transport system permease protein